MNKPIRGAEPATQLAEDQIADFLVAHPDFFERHGAVLARIKLPHQRGSAAISLVERQVLPVGFTPERFHLRPRPRPASRRP